MDPDPYQQAIELIKDGQNLQGRQVLLSYLQDHPQHEAAWLWLVQTLSSDAERIQTLETCLKFNPHSQIARQALEHFKSLAATPPEPVQPAVQAPGEELPVEPETVFSEPVHISPFMPGEEDFGPPVVESRPIPAATSVSPQTPRPAAPAREAPPEPARPSWRRPGTGLLVAGVIILVAIVAAFWLGQQGLLFNPSSTSTVQPTETPVAGFEQTKAVLGTRIEAGLLETVTIEPTSTFAPSLHPGFYTPTATRAP